MQMSGIGSMKRPGKEPDDLLGLLILANKNLKGVKITFKKHPVAESEPKVEKLIGYNPAGTFQILFEKNGKIISCIRGAVSFGLYEIMMTKGAKPNWKAKDQLRDPEDPERYGDPKDVIKRIRDILY